MIPFDHVRAFAFHPLMRCLVRAIVLAALLVPSPAAAQTPQPAAPKQLPPREPLECKNANPLSGDFVSTVTPDGRGLVRGRVIIVCDDTQVYANEITWDDKMAWASGDVLVIQPGLRVTAERAELDHRTKLGAFFNASGTARLTDQDIPKNQFGTMEPEITFVAAKVEKIGAAKYRLTDGWFTTCLQTPPRWEIVGSQGTITLDEHVLLKNAVFRVKGIPVLYLPIIYYPITKDDRSTGFLLPTYSASNVIGQSVSNAFFWAIDRSQDATFFHDYMSRTGQRFGTEYRFRNSDRSAGRAEFLILNEKTQLATDGSVMRPAQRSYTLNAESSQEINRRLRVFGRARYYSNLQTQQLYQQNLYDFSARDRWLTGTLQGNYNFGRVQALVEQRDIYRTATLTERQGRLPQFNLWLNRKTLGRSGITVVGNAEMAGIERQINLNDPLSSRSLWRFDGMPTVSAPIFRNLAYLDTLATASWRFTQWSDSQHPLTGQLVGSSLTRSLFEFRTDVTGPKFARTFKTPKSGYAESFKHEIAPRITYAWLSRFDDRNLIVQNDGVDSLATGTSRIDYGIYNRVTAKVKREGGSSFNRPILNFSVSQSYYTDARAAAFDTQYQATTIGTFSNIDIRADADPSDHWRIGFRTLLDPKTFEPATYSVAASLRRTVAQIAGTWTQSRFRASPTDDFLTMATHSVGTFGSLRTKDERYGGTFSFDVDVKNRVLLDQRYSFFYNAQCCGFGVEYQITNIEHLNQADKFRRTFNFTFTLAGIGSFSNPMGSFRQ